jgi:hypothetical protein
VRTPSDPDSVSVPSLMPLLAVTSPRRHRRAREVLRDHQVLRPRCNT